MRYGGDEFVCAVAGLALEEVAARPNDGVADDVVAQADGAPNRIRSAREPRLRWRAAAACTFVGAGPSALVGVPALSAASCHVHPRPDQDR